MKCGIKKDTQNLNSSIILAIRCSFSSLVWLRIVIIQLKLFQLNTSIGNAQVSSLAHTHTHKLEHYILAATASRKKLNKLIMTYALTSNGNDCLNIYFKAISNAVKEMELHSQPVFLCNFQLPLYPYICLFCIYV